MTGVGFSVRIFIPGGEPEGLRLVEKSNWTGIGLVFPRVQMPEVRKREQLQRTGVYILWGPAETSHLHKIYVGEGGTVLPRLDQHARQKDFWTHAAVFVSKDDNLNKAHVQHLESRLVDLASAAKKAELDNATVPQAPKLSEADKADAEGFLANLLLCLPIMGIHFFEQPRTSPPGTDDLLLHNRRIEAYGQENADGFVVRAGSQAVKEEQNSIHPYLADLRQVLIAQGVLEDSGTTYRFTQDYLFSSPSTAAGVLLGRPANGRITWKDRHGNTLKQLQETALATGDDS